MLHLILGKQPWFVPKRFGLGAGWPIAWQGWALIASFVGLIGGLAALASANPSMGAWPLLMIGVPAVILFVFVSRRRTAGEWRWRWGSND